MATYICGPSILHLTGQAEPVQPGSTFAHDFSVDGPEGEHGPDREAALLAAGAIARAAPPAVLTPIANLTTPAPAAPTTDGQKE